MTYLIGPLFTLTVVGSILGYWIRRMGREHHERMAEIEADANRWIEGVARSRVRFDAERAERAAVYAAKVAEAEAAIDRAAAPRHPAADPDAIANRLRELDSNLDISTAVATDGAVTVVVRRKEQPALP